MTPDRFDAALPHLVDVPAAVHERLLSLFDDRSTPVTERLVRNDDHWSATLAVRGDGDGDGGSGPSPTLVFRGSSVDLIVDVSAVPCRPSRVCMTQSNWSTPSATASISDAGSPTPIR